MTQEMSIGLRLLGVLPGAALMVGCQGEPGAAIDYHVVVASADRSDAEHETDKRREPAQLLAFAGVISGIKVLEIGAGRGYTADLLARTVGSKRGGGGRVQARSGR